jgi:hypothetical protein
MNCLHFKKLPGKMMVYCKLKTPSRLFEVSRKEVTKEGVIHLAHRKSFSIANFCPNFVTMEDDDCDDAGTFL